MKIIFFGPPGSGKGTQAKLTADKFNISHLSTGDILREKLKGEDDLSNELKKIMSSGDLVSDSLLNSIVADKLTSKDMIKGFILDGYPRTLAQSDFLISYFNKKNLELDIIINFKIDFKLVEQRIIKRFEKEKRSDDSIDIIKNRLEKYMSETHPVSRVFEEKYSNIYYSIDAGCEISEIQKEIIKIIKKRRKLGEN